MASEFQQQIETSLSGVIDPNTGKNLLESGFIHSITDVGDGVELRVRFAYPLSQDGLEQWQQNIKTVLQESTGLPQIEIKLDWKVVSHRVQAELKPLAGIKNILVVASGKGGVGKSTTAVNLAAALQLQGARVGMLDADIYGPSLPRMLGLSGKPQVSNEKFTPKNAAGMPVMSMGFLVDDDTPMVWRGPMVTSALQQLLNETNWQEDGQPLDYLILDLPPGTGDIQLTLAQKVPVAGAIIVTTPQDIALQDARKGLEMFKQVKVPVLGIVENMSLHTCSNCGHEEALFGAGGGAGMAVTTELPLLGQLPLDIRIRELSDVGQPIVRADPQSPAAQAYIAAALRAVGELSQQARDRSLGMPEFIVQN